MKALTNILIMWLIPWGFLAGLLIYFGMPGIGISLGLGSLLAVTFVLALARAAKDN